MALINRTFLGKNCDGGVSTAMNAKLTATEVALSALWTADVVAGRFAGTLADWAQLRQNHGAAHPGGQHTAGDAMDVNYQTNPYIVTRTPTAAGRVVYGGEAPSPLGTPVSAALHAARLRATVVFDRAVAFVTTSTSLASVSARAAAEPTLSVLQRFGIASNALARYLQLVFVPTLPTTLTVPAHVTHAPVANAARASLATLLAGIPAAARLPDATVRANIAAALADPLFVPNHPGWSTNVDFWYTQILRDYEVVRIPMQFGAVSLAPASTRNPANGFLDLRSEVILALASDPPLPGVMRWGICDFGSAASGDVQHFDLAGRLPSGVAGALPPDVRIDVTTTAGVQQALGSLGFDAGVVDGVAGSATTNAVNAFRASRTPPLASGGIDDDLRDALRNALTEAAIPF
jgi:hypothetical protein